MTRSPAHISGESGPDKNQSRRSPPDPLATATPRTTVARGSHRWPTVHGAARTGHHDPRFHGAVPLVTGCGAKCHGAQAQAPMTTLKNLDAAPCADQDQSARLKLQAQSTLTTQHPPRIRALALELDPRATRQAPDEGFSRQREKVNKKGPGNKVFGSEVQAPTQS
jgi:hypothetical protein